MKTSFYQKGLTLIEILLALAIAVLILIMGLRMILFWQKEMVVTQVKYNVDTLFKSQQAYYNAQCFGIYVPNNATVNNAPIPPIQLSGYNYAPGRVAPTRYFSPPSPVQSFYYAGSVANLIATGYLAGNSKNTDHFPFSPNALVQNANKKVTNKNLQGEPVFHGYAVFFVQYLTKRKLATYNKQSATIGVQAVTMAGVGVLLNVNGSKVRQAYAKLLGATCLADAPQTNCQEPDSSGKYAVWLRPANAPSAHNVSDTWVSNPQVVQFQQLYTTYPTTYLTSTSPKIAVTQENQQYFQYFLCTN